MSIIKHSLFTGLFLVLFLADSLAQQANGNKLFTVMPESTTGLNFRNDIIETETMFLYIYEYLYVGAGVSVGDINNDGLPDIYFTSTLGSNKLYLNLGGFKFQPSTLVTIQCIIWLQSRSIEFKIAGSVVG